MGHSKSIFAEQRATSTPNSQQHSHDAAALAAFKQKEWHVLKLWASLEKAQEAAREVPLEKVTNDYCPSVIATLDALDEAMATLKQLFPVILERA